MSRPGGLPDGGPWVRPGGGRAVFPRSWPSRLTPPLSSVPTATDRRLPWPPGFSFVIMAVQILCGSRLSPLREGSRELLPGCGLGSARPTQAVRRQHRAGQISQADNASGRSHLSRSPRHVSPSLCETRTTFASWKGAQPYPSNRPAADQINPQSDCGRPPGCFQQPSTLRARSQSGYCHRMVWSKNRPPLLPTLARG